MARDLLVSLTDAQTTAKKAAAAARSWILLDGSGEATELDADKYEIMHRVQIHARDLRILDPLLSYPSTILGREGVIVLNLEHIKAIITHEEVLLRDPYEDNVIPIVEELRRRLPPSSVAKQEHGEGRENLSEQHDVEAAEEDESPFEFRALEVALEAICSFLDARTTELETAAYPALDELTSKVPFGMIVQCPVCTIAIAVAQPQQGIQVASCSKCRYQYQLVSGDIVSIVSEVVSMDNSAWARALRFLQVMQENTPAARHSIVVRTPTGTASTHKFATKTVELPAQEGERVTVSLAAPSNVYREMGPLKLSAKSPRLSPGEPMCLTNHTSGQVSQLLRAPTNDGNSFLLKPSILFPALTLLATGDAASGIIDPSLPRLISVAAVASVALGTAVNKIVIPQLSKLPQRTVDIVALKQQLLSQYDLLQTRIKDLRRAAEKEVWMLARMCQLENKIVAVGEPSYRARRVRVKRIRESLENSLLGRIELIESYAKISSMIEIEVEMDSDVLAAEAVSNAENIAEQIEQMMEIENLEERWRIQAEANDEVERLLSAQPLSAELV